MFIIIIITIGRRRRAYIALQLCGVDRVSDVDVILESLQSDHLPFVLLKFRSVFLLK